MVGLTGASLCSKSRLFSVNHHSHGRAMRARLLRPLELIPALLLLLLLELAVVAVEELPKDEPLLPLLEPVVVAVVTEARVVVPRVVVVRVLVVVEARVVVAVVARVVVDVTPVVVAVVPVVALVPVVVVVTGQTPSSAKSDWRVMKPTIRHQERGR